MRRSRLFLLAPVAALLVTVTMPAAVHGDPTFDSRLAADTSADCFGHSWSPALASRAQYVAQEIANSGNFANNLGGGAGAENVGWSDQITDPTQAADAINQAYMNSPEHHANICDTRWHSLGVGSVFLATWNCSNCGGSEPKSNVWVDAVEFGNPASGGSTPPPHPARGPSGSAPQSDGGDVPIPGTGGAL